MREAIMPAVTPHVKWNMGSPESGTDPAIENN